jgi:hypothetical protein
MRYEVWFVRVGENAPDGSVISFPFSAEEAPKFPSVAYRLVGTVEARNSEDAWHRANHGYHPWFQKPDGSARLAPGVDPTTVRSMSIGDVLLDEHGTALVADTFGFKPLVWKAEVV